jgi:CubicO group peptidase (beta-lactamase class C family)
MIDTASLDDYLTTRALDGSFSGVVLITRGGEEIFSGAYGWASRAWSVPNTVDIRFDTASITKLFTSVVALQAVDEGLLSLDTRAVEYLGLEATAIHPDASLHHLLTHTSGIGDDADEEAGEEYADLWIDKPNYSVRETADFLPQFVNKPGNFAPGNGCRYCNVAFILAALMVERATGVTYRNRVREFVFGPAAMTESGFFEMDKVAPRVAEGADRSDDGTWIRNIYSYPPVGSPDGGAHVTAADLWRFLVAVQNGVLLSSELTRAFLSPVASHSTNDVGERKMGYGLEFQYDTDASLLFYEKEGYNAGTSGVLRHYPAIDTTVVLLGNTANSVWEPRRYIDSMLGI